MVDNKLVEYIKENLQKGHSLQEIRKFVVNYGWSEKDFDQAVLLASGSLEKKPEKKEAPQEGAGETLAGKKKGHKRVIIALVILVIVIFIFLFVVTDMLDFFADYYPDNLLPINLSIFS
ncbi:MAG: hypothetical protein JXC85_03075 [Candidatus Aenigmarchaeota archaeon]|nr:hypothetical protein [Candidatus Aenigmarchaeota archaeon]